MVQKWILVPYKKYQKYCTCFQNNLLCSSFFLIEIKDLKDVIEYVFELNMSQFKQLGLQLGLLQPTLDKLTDGTKPEDYGTKVMTEWLNQVDKAQPTWNNLAKALDKRTVKAQVQATQLREDLKNGTIN